MVSAWSTSGRTSPSFVAGFATERDTGYKRPTWQGTRPQINGKSYVDFEMLARLTIGTLGFKGSQITLTLPAPAAGTPAMTPTASQLRVWSFRKLS